MKILIGLHEKVTRECVEFSMLDYGHEFYSSRDLSDMLGKLNSEDYDIYLMDLNYGNPGSTNINPASTIYNLVKNKIENGKARFLGISHNDSTVEIARKSGIPSIDHIDLDILENLFNLK